MLRYNTFKVLGPQEMELLGEWSSDMDDILYHHHMDIEVGQTRLK